MSVLIPFRNIIDTDFENHTKQVPTMCGKMQTLTLKEVVHTVITFFKSVGETSEFEA